MNAQGKMFKFTEQQVWVACGIKQEPVAANGLLQQPATVNMQKPNKDGI